MRTRAAFNACMAAAPIRLASSTEQSPNVVIKNQVLHEDVQIIVAIEKHCVDRHNDARSVVDEGAAAFIRQLEGIFCSFENSHTRHYATAIAIVNYSSADYTSNKLLLSTSVTPHFVGRMC
jgi:hypothetical protein